MKSMKSVPTQPALDVRGALKGGIARLRSAQVPSDALTAELLVIHATGRDRTWLYTHSDEPLNTEAAEKYLTLIERRAAGEPTQYLIGKQEFWGLEFEVTPAVLIPRPETEHLIEVALERIGPARRGASLRIADVGTGSGCIAIALAKEFPSSRIIATDISRQALEVAKRNSVRHEVAERIEFVQTDLLASFLRGSTADGQFHAVVSNPPYVARNDAHTLAREVREHEPEIALYGGPTGVEIYGRLIEQAGQLLVRGGMLLLELGYDSAERVRAIIEASGCWLGLSITNDLSGIPRVLLASRK